ncbi:similar to Saccharomyces cerevisiae YHL034C SBP1 Putative RNA binding protein [Maudiozyma barnettii]|uniref:Similar to Saccharomyces cerevisiae YHL034C SBP1 Putative RNA binding protein n=1 Tax=Maudiozyma barnettii TaxID=61262 RepID=A0A8H2VHZ5_9SACH|nr:uncharacterized protein KABA2_06S08888 [Kazachstania barnettii]CAB4255584.1 similar to Saccharomyces cerevisiae YHL034C SBP1 Putative RNA binding protein [Kazachstania barnettii]CAD1784082.1 similar to Saccharomyces cerevisiae YHL034C SBP1 Putative RNA binding protein [Kazachstania barnettii]
MELELPPKEIVLKDTTNIKEKLKTKAKPKKKFEPGKSSIYIGNIPIECTKKDLQSYFKDEKEVLNILLRTTKIKVAGQIKVIKFAFVSFNVDININELNTRYYNNQLFGNKSLFFEKVGTKESNLEDIENIDEKRIKTSDVAKLEPTGPHISTNVKKDTKKEEENYPKSFPKNTQIKVNDEKKPVEKEFVKSKHTSKDLASSNTDTKQHTLQIKKSEKTIFIKNIPYDITKKELAEFLKVKGRDVSLPKGRLQDLTTGRIFISHNTNRGYSFVTYENLGPEETIQQKVEGLQGMILKNRKLMVDFAIDKEEHNDSSVPTTIISVTKM